MTISMIKNASPLYLFNNGDCITPENYSSLELNSEEKVTFINDINAELFFNNSYYAVVTMGDGYYPLPLLFGTKEDRVNSAIATGCLPVSENWVARKRNKVLAYLKS